MRSRAEIDKAAENYYFTPQQIGIDNRCRERMIHRCMRYVSPGHVLELGFMDGQWTDHFLAKGCKVTAVEGAERNFRYGQHKYKKNPAVAMVHSTFEDFQPKERFDLIYMGGMLKHLEAPTDLLRRSVGWLTQTGYNGPRLIATTPNARSMHRRVGVYMGALDDFGALSETDRKVGNLRHYDLHSFQTLLQEFWL